MADQRFTGLPDALYVDCGSLLGAENDLGFQWYLGIANSERDMRLSSASVNLSVILYR